jgi:pyrroline-5-carboxylate reductase
LCGKDYIIENRENEEKKMTDKKVGFIGGGRITRILLEGFKRGGATFHEIVVSDLNVSVLTILKERFPEINIANDNRQPASRDIVFLALHPPAIKDVLGEIMASLNPNAVLVSLAPKVTIKMISETLGGFQRIVRMIPNACSLVNAGYNPIAFSEAISKSERDELLGMLHILGECPVVEENTLEAYAILTAMGPTYLWFQADELKKIGTSFGLSSEEVSHGLSKMVAGALKMYFESGLTSEEVMDLIPGKPLKDEEETIRTIYESRLQSLYKKLKG